MEVCMRTFHMLYSVHKRVHLYSRGRAWIFRFTISISIAQKMHKRTRSFAQTCARARMILLSPANSIYSYSYVHTARNTRKTTLCAGVGLVQITRTQKLCAVVMKSARERSSYFFPYAIVRAIAAICSLYTCLPAGLHDADVAAAAQTDSLLRTQVPSHLFYAHNILRAHRVCTNTLDLWRRCRRLCKICLLCVSARDAHV